MPSALKRCLLEGWVHPGLMVGANRHTWSCSAHRPQANGRAQKAGKIFRAFSKKRRAGSPCGVLPRASDGPQSRETQTWGRSLSQAHFQRAIGAACPLRSAECADGFDPPGAHRASPSELCCVPRGGKGGGVGCLGPVTERLGGEWFRFDSSGLRIRRAVAGQGTQLGLDRCRGGAWFPGSSRRFSGWFMGWNRGPRAARAVWCGEEKAGWPAGTEGWGTGSGENEAPARAHAVGRAGWQRCGSEPQTV